MKSRHQRRLPVEHVMIAAGENDFAALRALLVYMPEDVYGQVFIECASDDAWRNMKIAAPARMSMTRLRTAPPQVEHGVDTALATKNLTLARAITAWVDEWIPAEPTAERLVQMWVGAQGSPAIDELCGNLTCELERL